MPVAAVLMGRTWSGFARPLHRVQGDARAALSSRTPVAAVTDARAVPDPKAGARTQLWGTALIIAQVVARDAL
jgi:hypothetical protein